MTRTFQAGDNVYVHQYSSYISGVVQSVSPKGQLQILLGNRTETTRFLPNGHQMGEKYGYEIDQLPYEERTRWLADQIVLKKVVAVISQVVVGRNLNPQWGIKGVQAEINRLKLKLTEAETLLNEIATTPDHLEAT